MRGYSHADLVRHLEPAHAFETLFHQEDLHPPPQLVPVAFGQPKVEWEVAGQDLVPASGKRSRSGPVATKSTKRVNPAHWARR
jgi:hypothetical protein